MSGGTLLVAAYIAVWLLLLGYAAILALRQRGIGIEVEALREQAVRQEAERAP